MATPTRNALLIFVCGLCLLVSGCTAKFAQDVTVNEDGSFDTVYTIVGPEGIKSDIKKTFAEMQATDTRPIHDAETDWDGYEAGFHDANLAGFLQRMPSFQKIDKKQYDVRMESGWLYDAYSFHASFPEDKESAPPMHEYNPNDPNRFRYDFTLKLPYASEKNNADTVSEDGKVLYWNLAATVSEKGVNGVNIYTEFRLWHREHIGVTVVVLAILAFLYYRAKRCSNLNTPDSVNQKNISNICGVLFVAGLGWCLYSVLQFPTMTTANAINGDALSKVTEEKQETSLLSNFDTQVDTSNVKMETKEIPQGKLMYPSVVLPNQMAANAINQDILSFVNKFVDDIKRYNEKQASLSYDVRGNGDDYISIVLNKGTASSNSTTIDSFRSVGMVFDKRSGRRMLMKDFININYEQIKQEAKKEFYIYNKLKEGPKPFTSEIEESDIWKSQSTPLNNFFLDDNGNLFHLLPLTHIAKTDVGTTCVRFTPASVLKYRRGGNASTK